MYDAFLMKLGSVYIPLTHGLLFVSIFPERTETTQQQPSYEQSI